MYERCASVKPYITPMQAWHMECPVELEWSIPAAWCCDADHLLDETKAIE